jgi:magnesium-transporting ATPase (P-type)
VTSGRARAVVVGTGAATAIGRIRDAMTVQVSTATRQAAVHLLPAHCAFHSAVISVDIFVASTLLNRLL